ncbi:MAG: hypothetical protein ACXWC0_28020, partial [Burkholderiales bacterium]
GVRWRFGEYRASRGVESTYRSRESRPLELFAALLEPEASLTIFDPLTLRVRAQWEAAAHDIVRGNNLWIILNYRF